MNKEELYDLIERYLDGVLSDAEREAVERRMANEADFRAEVELHRALHTSLSDADNFRLRNALDDLLRDPPPTDDTTNQGSASSTLLRWPQLVSIVVLIAVAGWFMWQWLSPDNKSLSSPIPQPPQDQTSDTTSTPEQKLPLDTPSSQPVRPKPNKPIAMADPADFKPNPVLEARIGDMVRGNGIGFELTSPAAGASFQLRNGRIALPIRGTVTGGGIPADQPLELLIYPNRPEAWDDKQPIATFSLPLTPYAPDSYQTEFRPMLRTRPGLYYLIVGQRRLPGDDGHIVLWVGKFTVQPGEH